METDLRRKVAWLIAVRAMVTMMLLGGATVAQITAPHALAADPFFALIAGTFGLTFLFTVLLRHVDRHRWLVDVQLACDAVVVSAFIHVTGGVTSYFSLLYALPITAASVVQFRRGALLVATLSTVLYVGLVLSQYVPGPAAGLWFSSGAGPLPSSGVALYVVALNIFGFFAVALLSGSMAESVRSAGVRLQRASTEIADLQALNQNVVDSMPSGVLATDPEQRVLTFNRAAETICGQRFQDVQGRLLADVLQLPPAVLQAFSDGMAAGGARRLEFRFRRPDGQDLDLGLSASYVETPGGRVGYLVTFQDLTDVKRREREARIQQRLAAVGEMAAGIAHEIRNPLASMSGSIQILRSELPLTEDQALLMDIVLRESDRLNTTIRSFLDYARPHRFSIERFDLRRAVNDTVLLLRNSADVHESHRIDADVPREAVWVEADEGQIKQILWNLATNGLRAMPDGGRLVLAAGTDTDGNVLLRVTDEGIGIPPEAVDGLFQPFHGSFAKGSGLGLAIVHRIVTDYHGDIHVDSAPGAGTTVSVRLPARAGVTT